MRLVYLFTIGFTVIALSTIWTGFNRAEAPINYAVSFPTTTVPVDATSPAGWFQAMRPFCNPVEVATHHRRNPAPEGMQGTAYSAACFALAGDVDTARELILGLKGDDQWRAAGVVFNVGHPVADAGDDLAAAPIMELVVEFWPNHYMALYHAGAARFELGDHHAATEYLTRFLEHYDHDDWWVKNANEMLSKAQ